MSTLEAGVMRRGTVRLDWARVMEVVRGDPVVLKV
jgi:hypothetical protein